MKNKLGFTLIEMLVVVLIIGILAGIALPQYQMAVTKAKVASILPLMRRWKDANVEWKLLHGAYDEGGSLYGYPTAEELGVNWPSDWESDNGEARTECYNDYWYCDGSEPGGTVFCAHHIGLSEFQFFIYMYQPDDQDAEYGRGKTTCYSNDTPEGHKICKALGGKLIEFDGEEWGEYQLN